MGKARYSQRKNCEQCGKEYWAARKQSRFCSDNCRVAWHRFQQRPDSERTLFVLVNVIKQRIDMHQKSIEGRAARLADATGIMAQSLKELIREDEKIVEELQMLLTIKNNLELAEDGSIK